MAAVIIAMVNIDNKMTNMWKKTCGHVTRPPKREKWDRVGETCLE